MTQDTKLITFRILAASLFETNHKFSFFPGTTTNVMSATLLGNKRVDFRSFSTPLTGHQTITGKRKAPENSAGAAPVTRKAARTTKTQGNSTANGMFVFLSLKLD